MANKSISFFLIREMDYTNSCVSIVVQIKQGYWSEVIDFMDVESKC